jgi:hypothetical protein
MVFCAEADLSAAGGVHGLAEEHEDIRVEVIPADQAIRLLDAGVIEAGPAVVAGLVRPSPRANKTRVAGLARPVLRGQTSLKSPLLACAPANSARALRTSAR